MKKLIIIAISFLAFFQFKCGENRMKADKIFHNAQVYTVDPKFSIAEAFAVIDGKIAEVGTSKEILEKFVSNNLFDLQGQFVYPGFIDPHSHFYGFGAMQFKANLVGTGSLEEVIETVKSHHNEFPSKWIQGRGWDQNDWEEKEFPTWEKLNQAFPDNPVLLTRIDGHAALINKKALEEIGISADTVLDGGTFEFRNGTFTGILIDNAIEVIIEKIPKFNQDQKMLAFKKAQEDCFTVGLTSVCDAGLDKDQILLIDSLHKSGKLKMRIYAMLNPTDENFEYFMKKGAYQTHQLTVSSVKLYADGALGSRGARLIEPYSDDPENLGLFLHPEDYFQKWASRCIESGYQLNTHAIGDGGNRFVLDLYAQFLEKGNDKRWRIEHCQVVHPEDFERFGDLNVIPSIQTTHATSDMYWASERLGSKRVKSAYAFKQLLNEAGTLANGSDFPIESMNPLFGFYSGVVRKDHKGWPENGFQVENALTREEALMAMTIWAAHANFEDDVKGSLETGKLADFVLMKDDLMTASDVNLYKLEVEETWLSGENVYKKE